MNTPVENPSDEELESIMIDCTKSNFLEKSNDFIKRLPNAAFIAIDEEMSGIQLPDALCPVKISKDDTPEIRYPNLKKVPERYSIIQLGICLFEERGAGSFNVRRYKFTLFPPSDPNISKDVILNSGSVRFLSEENNCNLNEWIQEGIPFCTGKDATSMLDKYLEQEMKKKADAAKPSPDQSQRRAVELTRNEDKDFHARAMASLREWLDAAVVVNPGDLEGSSFHLPPCNSFLRRALYESIGKEYPNLVLETTPGTSQMRVWRLNAEERARRSERLLREGFEKLLTEKIGGWRVFLALALACSGQGPRTQAEHMALAADVNEALKPLNENQVVERRKIPLIVHNGLQDLLFLFTHFHTPELPSDWKDCKQLIHSHFPVIYDTKTIATEYCKDKPRGRTHLGALYEQVVATYPQWNREFTVNGKPQLQEQLHDAGYDSYCTGVVFHGLVSTINEGKGTADDGEETDDAPPLALWNSEPDDEDLALAFGRNKIHFLWSPYTIDLECPDSDPLAKGMSPCSTFKISGIDPSVTTRDIVRCLTGLQDSSGGRVNFEIVWVNDVCFIVGATLHSRDQKLFEEHGKIILNALGGRFKREMIQPLGTSGINAQQPSSSSSMWNLWGLLGSSKPAAAEPSESRPAKRRRVE